MSDFIATPTIEDFMLSPAYVRILAGPIGAGKSVACVHELIRWASAQAPDKEGARRTRFLVVRNTVDQLKSTTFRTICDWLPPSVFGTYRASEKVIQYKFALPDGTTVDSEWLLVSMDTPDDIRKALSLEATGLWLNECREIHPEVVDGLLMRVNRFPSMKDGGPTRAGAIGDTNMPGLESFWEQRMSNPPENWSVHVQPPAVIPLDEYIDTYNEDPPEALSSSEGNLYAINPGADNLANLAKGYYPNTLLGKTEDFIGVYLRCKFGRTLSGLPVYDKTFSATKHIAPTTLEPIRSDNYPLCIGLDFGRSPAAVICQLTPKGKIHVLSEVIGENMGIQTFVSTLLRPHLYEKYPGLPTYIAPDPAGWQRTQLGETSPVDYLKQAGFQIVRPPTNNPKLRIEAVDAALTASADASPRVQINKSCTTLLGGFRGGYKWKTNKAGDMVDSPEPIKNHYSHCVVGETLVSTPSGSRRIDSLAVGDLVNTPIGPRRVTATMNRVAACTMSFSVSDGRTVHCTGDHPVKTISGMVRADALQYGDCIILEEGPWHAPADQQNTHPSSSKGSGTTANPPGTTSETRSACPKELSDTCIARCGCFITDQYRKTQRYTTSITTDTTTRSATLPCSRAVSTRVTTRVSELGTEIRRFFAVLSRLGRPLKNGTGQTPVGLGIGNTPNTRSLPTSSQSKRRALIAAEPIPSTPEKRNAVSVLQRASRQLGALQAWTTRSVSVLFAGRRSPQTSTAKPSHVGDVVALSYGLGMRRVYDLTVDEAHEFYANGVLVGNCADAFQYAIAVIDGGFAGSQTQKRRQVQRAGSGGWT